MMSCKEAARLMSEALDRPLTAHERFALRLHTMICRGCSNYGKQMAFIRRATRRLRDDTVRSDESL